MGLLPSQKYDIVLKSFSRYLKENYAVIGFSETSDEYWIRNFLKECDEGGWEI